MTDAEILQSRYDRAHLRMDIVEVVQRGTPTRWSPPVRVERTRDFMVAYVRDYANGGLLGIAYARR